MSLRHNISPPIMRLQAFLRATAAPGREVVALDPFTAYFHPSDQLKYLNYAVPSDNAEPAEDEIERLRDAFRERDRLPRLEWVEEAAPQVVATLERAGMRRAILLHGADATVWPFVHRAAERNWSTRIGLEDGRELEDGTTASGNAALTAAAVAIFRAGR